MIRVIISLFLLFSFFSCVKERPQSCDDNMQNQNETNLDCGGVCRACPTCSDNILNQNETYVDCGGICDDCGDCEDGIKNQDEAGIDCGGVCQPCSTTTCDTEIGFGENGYLENGKASLNSSAETFEPSQINDLNFKLTIHANFPIYSTCNGYIIKLNRGDFLKLANNETQVFTTDDSNSSHHASECSVSVFMPMGYLTIKSLQKVYLKRISYSTFNIRFCNLINHPSGTYNLNTSFSANTNFTIN